MTQSASSPASFASPLRESKWTTGLNRWQYWCAVFFASFILIFWGHGGNFPYALSLCASILFFATAARLSNLGRSVFSLATLAQVLGGMVIFFTFSKFLNRSPITIIAASTFVSLLPCLYLPPKFEIYRQVDRSAKFLIVVSLLIPGGFTCYWYFVG